MQLFLRLEQVVVFVGGGPLDQNIPFFKYFFFWLYMFSFVLQFYRTHVSLGSDIWVLLSVSTRLCADLTYVTLADGANRAISNATRWPKL